MNTIILRREEKRREEKRREENRTIIPLCFAVLER